MENRGIQAALTTGFGAFLIYFNNLLCPILVLLFFMVIDYISGMVNAWRKKELSSKIGIDGIIKKVGYMFLVAVAMGIDYIISAGLVAISETNLSVPMCFGILVTVWLIINEMISITENLDKLGVPLPKFIISVIKRLKTNSEKIFESEEKQDEKRN